ncbi:MAG: mandelate racemase [bacterium]|nr:mandelate racemase [bacterium]MDE0502338.1 mandelate racemase [bacterium]
MKITGATVYIVALPTRRHHSWASKMTAPIGRHAILRLRTDEGLEGWGEAPAGITWGGSAMRYYGESPETVRIVALDYLLPAVGGCDPREIAVVHARMDRAVKGHPYAKAMIDMASYDLAGRAMGVGVPTLLGGSHRRGIELAHSLGIMPIERCLQEAEQAVSEGALTIKCKTGLDPFRDVELVRRLRELVGPGIKIRVDGNEGYSHVAEAVRVTRAQEEYDIMLCEQPVAGAEGLAAVAQRIETPVMADESAWTVEDIWELADLGAADYFSCYVTKPGGLFRARQQAETARRLGILCDIGGSIETGIGNAANLALGAAVENAALPSVCPVSGPWGSARPEIAGIYYTDDLITAPFGFEDGRVLVPEGPGLGVEVDVAKVEKYSVAEAVSLDLDEGG